MVQLTATPMRTPPANESGEVDLEHASSLGGDYLGVHPIGLFWSLKAENVGNKLSKKDVMNSPLYVTLKLYDSDFDIYLKPSIPPKYSLTVERWFAAPGVSRVRVAEGHIQRSLFLPPGEDHLPRVIDLYGAVGKLFENQASLLASHGVVTMALAFSNYKDLLPILVKYKLQYFEEAINFLLRHPNVLGPGIGVLSLSKGAELGLTMAIHLKQVVATVLINGVNFIGQVPHEYCGHMFETLTLSSHLVCTDNLGFIEQRYIFEEHRSKASSDIFHPIEKVQGHFLFIVGEDNRNVNSKLNVEQAIEWLRRNGKNNWSLLSCREAGHLIDSPYTPVCYASQVAHYKVCYALGGSVVPPAAAQEHSWKEIQKFLRKHLSSVVISQL
ncbi:bile acid-CoA:amino acid N-acyltransferase-like [Saccopteryx leptura]|uniref:bile acid-CoA:amino acid N-acyltransferase-like n=1 Tax=Saccopteryx leptura TaxID=249018 RepID=UPI00339BFF6D